MQAVILAAGIGSRMGSTTKSIPKCLVEINGRKIISHQIDILNENGINNIVVVVGHYKEKIKKYLKNKVIYVENPIFKESNSSYSLWLAREFIIKDFVYLNCDLFFNSDILKKLLNTKFENAIAIDSKITNFNDDMFKAHMIGDQIQELKKNLAPKKINAVAPGPVKFSKKGKKRAFEKLNEYIKNGDRNQWCYTIFSKIAKEVNLKGIDITGLPWIEIDTCEDLEEAKKILIK